MAFTYSDGSGADRDNVRSAINDVTENAGPLPGQANFTDARIDALITVEGNWRRAVAAAYETLAAAWAVYTDVQVGSRHEMSHLIASRYDALAARWRDLYGKAASSANTSGSLWVTRVDGYSDDIDAGEV